MRKFPPADLYVLACRSVEEGVQYGVRRFYKHRDDTPGEETLERMVETVTSQVMNQLCEDFRFNE